MATKKKKKPAVKKKAVVKKKKAVVKKKKPASKKKKADSSGSVNKDVPSSTSVFSSSSLSSTWPFPSGSRP